jgi:hypothetical protein
MNLITGVKPSENPDDPSQLSFNRCKQYQAKGCLSFEVNIAIL